jgi:DNA-binding MarR family transcriptional regulator
MVKLTDSQLIVLSAAAARDDGLAVVPAKMNKAGAAKVGTSLITRKLMRGVKTKPGMPVWRHDEDGRPISLMITKAGRNAIGVAEAAPAVTARADKKPNGAKALAKNAPKERAGRSGVQPAPTALTPRAGSKQALVISMLSGKSGATLDDLIEATGWLPHTTRAALTGLRQKGFSIERTREKDASVYRLSVKASATGG